MALDPARVNLCHPLGLDTSPRKYYFLTMAKLPFSFHISNLRKAQWVGRGCCSGTALVPSDTLVSGPWPCQTSRTEADEFQTKAPPPSHSNA